MKLLIEKLKTAFSLDLRSLALFRIGLALCILCDLYERSTDLVAHYTDSGLLPRAALLERGVPKVQISLHMASGSAGFEAFLFLAAALLAIMLLIGWRTRLASWASWILLLSLQWRNPMVLQGGDVFFRMLLFWSLFLPLGARYSVDSALNPEGSKPPSSIFSMGTAGLMLQCAFVYWFTAAIKLQPGSQTIWWKQGTAVAYALHIDQFALPLAHYLLNYPEFLKALNYGVILGEIFIPFLFFFPVLNHFCRLAAVGALLALHTGFGLCLYVGTFTWISITSTLALLPGAFWSWVRFGLRKENDEIKIYYDADCGFCKKMAFLLQTFCFLPESNVLTAQSVPAIQQKMEEKHSWVIEDKQGNLFFEFEAFLKVLKASVLFFPLAWVLNFKIFKAAGTFLYRVVASHRPFFGKLLSPLKFRPVKIKLSMLGNALALFFIIYTFLWNLRTVRSQTQVPITNLIAFSMGLDQYWNMFSPPLTDDGWYVIPGKLRDGSEVDLFKNGGPVTWEKPKDIAHTYKNHRWGKYMMNIWMRKNMGHRLHYGRYLCRDWNSRHPAEKLLDRFQIIFMREDTDLYKSSQPKKVVIWSHHCFQQPLPKKT